MRGRGGGRPGVIHFFGTFFFAQLTILRPDALQQQKEDGSLLGGPTVPPLTVMRHGDRFELAEVTTLTTSRYPVDVCLLLFCCVQPENFILKKHSGDRTGTNSLRSGHAFLARTLCKKLKKKLIALSCCFLETERGQKKKTDKSGWKTEAFFGLF